MVMRKPGMGIQITQRFTINHCSLNFLMYLDLSKSGLRGTLTLTRVSWCLKIIWAWSTEFIIQASLNELISTNSDSVKNIWPLFNPGRKNYPNGTIIIQIGTKWYNCYSSWDICVTIVPFCPNSCVTFLAGMNRKFGQKLARHICFCLYFLII